MVQGLPARGLAARVHATQLQAVYQRVGQIPLNFDDAYAQWFHDRPLPRQCRVMGWTTVKRLPSPSGPLTQSKGLN